MMKKPLIDSDCFKKLNVAIEHELGHFYLYSALSNIVQVAGYFGAQAFFLNEAKEEIEHYQRHVDFVNNMGGLAKLPILQPLPNPLPSNLQEVLSLAYDREQSLLEFYKTMYKSEALSSPQVGQHLLFFIETQTQALGLYGDLLNLLESESDNPNIFMIIDEKMKNL